MRRIFALLMATLLLPACGISGGGTLSPTIAPASPSQVTAAPGNRSATLTWDSSSAGASYTIWRAFSIGGPFVPITKEEAFLDPTTYVDDDLANGTTYYYQVKARNAFGESAGSEVASATPAFKATAIAASWSNAMALLPDRTVWCWGHTNLDEAVQHGLPQDQSAVPTQVPGLRGVGAISTAPGCSMALLGDGSVWWWGAFVNSTPARVPDVAGIVAISAGGYKTYIEKGGSTGDSILIIYSVILPFGLSLASDGTVWAWGDNSAGQLGNGTSTPVNEVLQLDSVPAPVKGLPKMTAISAGSGFCLALAADGTVWSWGNNSTGQLGIGSISSNPVTLPVRIPNFTEVVAISAGSSGALALRSDGTVWAWGDNHYGQLGNGATGLLAASTPAPVQFPAGVTAKAVAMGERHALALGDDGALWSWGDNRSGELGNGAVTTAAVTRPSRTGTLTGAVGLAAGTSIGLATLADGTVYSWGDNSSGAVGVGTGRVHTTATPVGNLTDAVGVAAGDSFAAAVRADGSIWTWGGNGLGELGTGAVGASRVLPAPIPGLSGFTAVSASGSTGFGIHSSGTVWAWGANPYGQLGNGKTGGPPAPTSITGLTGVKSIVAGNTCFAVCTDGSLWGWGDNQYGQVGNGTSGPAVTKPVRITGLGVVVGAACGGGFTVAVQSDGTIWSWGTNSMGELGRGSGTPGTTTPVLVPGLSGATAVAAASYTGFALLGDGTFWVWGQQYFLHGDGLATPQGPAPVHNLSFTGIQTLSATSGWASAIRTDGSSWAWGYNGTGQVGNGVAGVEYVGTPSRIRNLPKSSALASGGGFGLALVGDKVWGWGDNQSNQLGRPYVESYATPVVISR
jgi:alpha-tubulin suppressor-like RCC1 family protein